MLAQGTTQLRHVRNGGVHLACPAANGALSKTSVSGLWSSVTDVRHWDQIRCTQLYAGLHGWIYSEVILIEVCACLSVDRKQRDVGTIAYQWSHTKQAMDVGETLI